MGHGVDDLARVIDDIGTVIDRDALAHGLAANGQGRHQTGKSQRHDGSEAELKILEPLGRDGGGGGAGDARLDS